MDLLKQIKQVEEELKSKEADLAQWERELDSREERFASEKKAFEKDRKEFEKTSKEADAKLKAIEAQGQQLQKVEQEKERNAKNERQFELFKMKKQFEYDYKLKWGKSPGELMQEAVNSTPQEVRGAQQPVPPTPPAEQQSAEQPQMV